MNKAAAFVVVVMFATLASASPAIRCQKDSPLGQAAAPYLERMIDAVQIQWDQLVGDRRIGAEAIGTKVAVTFTLNDAGEVKRISVSDTKAGEKARAACVDAIKSRAPFGPWSDDMKQKLGAEQRITLSFFYQ